MRALFFSFIVLIGCGAKTPLKFDDGSVKVSPNLVRSISYNEVKDKVFDMNCIACHGEGGGVNLESYESAYQHLEAIRQTVLVHKTMPKKPFKELSTLQLEMVAAWIEAGGPNGPLDGEQAPKPETPKPEVPKPETPKPEAPKPEAPKPEVPKPEAPKPEAPELKPTFTSIKKLILDKKCISCHSADGPAARIPISTRDDLVNSPLSIIVPGDADESGLLIVLEPSSRKFMPPTRSGISPVNEEEKRIIREWIEKGAF